MLAIEMLSEPVHVPDIPVSGLAHIEDLEDGTYRLTLYARRQSLHGAGTEYTVECRLIAAPSAMLHGAMLVLKVLGVTCICAGKRMLH